MGNTNSTQTTTQKVDEPQSACPVRSNSPSSSNDKDVESACPIRSSPNKKSVYNVYNQKIDTTNNMPSNANQIPSEGQTIALEINRVKSTIPKGGTDGETWQYPSPQMFWNACCERTAMCGFIHCANHKVGGGIG